MTQPFKENDDLEARMSTVLGPMNEAIVGDRTEMYEGAFQAALLGDVLWETKRHPLAENLPKDLFRKVFYVIDDFFTRPGTFDFYTDVFRVLFGDSVEIIFEVPGPGRLTISLKVLEYATFRALFREIVSNSYTYPNFVTEDGDQILFQDTQGLRTQQQFDRIMGELQTAGIWTVATLTT